MILSNGSNRWSVQTKSTIFYRKMYLNEIKEQYEDEIEELNEKIKKLKKDLRKYKDVIKKLKS